MTSERDFDRIVRAWLDLGPNEAPDRAIDSVLQAIETTPQVRRPIRWPFWRPTIMTRLPVLAVVAAILIIIAGMIALSGGGLPQPAATASPATSAQTLASPSASAAAIPSPGSVPDAIIGGWVAPARGIAGLEEGPIATIFFSEPGANASPNFGVDRPGFDAIQPSRVEAVAPDMITVTSASTSGFCTIRDVGRYRWSVSADGAWLTLAAEGADACDARQRVMTGTWYRSLAHDNRGGPGIAARFLPFMQLSLPTGTYVGRGTADTDTVVVDSSDGTWTFKVWKDLDGFKDPCDLTKGRLDLDPGMDAFIKYVTDDPRFRVVTSVELTIDGHRAVALDLRIGEELKEPCWKFDNNAADRSGVLTWNPHAARAGFWNGQIGSSDSLVVTEVDGATLVFEVVGSDGKVDRKTLDTVRFVNALPTPPAS